MFLLTLAIGILPGFAWLVFYLSEDAHSEPKRLIALAFFAGIAFGFFTVIIERIFNQAASDAGVPLYSILSLLGLAVIEEIMKFSAAYFTLSKTPEMADPLDPMIYMIVAALGFATLENIGAVANLPIQSSFLATAFETVSFRFVGATLLHTLTSGIVGYLWSAGISSSRAKWYVPAGIVLAALVHGTFNYLILNYGNIVYSVILLIVVGLFVLSDFEKLRAKDRAR